MFSEMFTKYMPTILDADTPLDDPGIAIRLRGVGKAYRTYENKNDFMFGFTPNYIKVKIPFNTSNFNSILNLKLENIDVDGNCLAY